MLNGILQPCTWWDLHMLLQWQMHLAAAAEIMTWLNNSMSSVVYFHSLTLSLLFIWSVRSRWPHDTCCCSPTHRSWLASHCFSLWRHKYLAFLSNLIATSHYWQFILAHSYVLFVLSICSFFPSAAISEFNANVAAAHFVGRISSFPAHLQRDPSDFKFPQPNITLCTAARSLCQVF